MKNHEIIEIKIPFTFDYLSEEDIKMIMKIQDYYLEKHEIYLTRIDILELALQSGSINHIKNRINDLYQITRCKSITSKIIKSDK